MKIKDLPAGVAAVYAFGIGTAISVITWSFTLSICFIVHADSHEKTYLVPHDGVLWPIFIVVLNGVTYIISFIAVFRDR